MGNSLKTPASIFKNYSNIQFIMEDGRFSQWYLKDSPVFQVSSKLIGVQSTTETTEAMAFNGKVHPYPSKKSFVLKTPLAEEMAYEQDRIMKWLHCVLDGYTIHMSRTLIFCAEPSTTTYTLEPAINIYHNGSKGTIVINWICGVDKTSVSKQLIQVN